MHFDLEPSLAYKAFQSERTYLMTPGDPDRRRGRLGARRQWLLDQMVGSFCSTFDLVAVPRSRLISIWRKFARARQVIDACPRQHQFFDHVSLSRSNSDAKTLVIVTQPYATYDEVEDQAHRAIDLGCEFHVIDPWAWYYPGRACCCALVIPSPALKAIANAYSVAHLR